MELLCCRMILPSSAPLVIVEGTLRRRSVLMLSFLRPPPPPPPPGLWSCTRRRPFVVLFNWNKCRQENEKELRSTVSRIPIAKNNCFVNSEQFISGYGNKFIKPFPHLCNFFKFKPSNCSVLKNLDLNHSVVGVGSALFHSQLFPYSTDQSKVNLPEKATEDLTKNANVAKKSTTDLPYGTILTVPNVLTMLRMVLAPVLGYLVLQEAYSPACGVFVVAGLTDMLDGFIARNFQNQTSALGSFIDPLADKLLISILFISLTAVNLLPVALTALVVTRDVCLASAGFYVRYISLNPRPKSLREYFDITNPSAKLQPTLISKVNTAVQLSVVAFTLAAPVFDYVEHPALQALWYLTAVTTVLSGVGYIFAKDTFKLLKQTQKDH